MKFYQIILQFLFILLFITSKINAQNEYCNVLTLTVQTLEFKKFIGKSISDSTKIFYDHTKTIQQCSLTSVDFTTFSFSSDSSLDNLSPNVGNNNVSRNLIIIYGSETNKNYITIRLWRPINNATLIVHYKKKGGKYQLVKTEQGNF